MRWLLALLAVATTNPAQITFTQDGSQASRRKLADKLADIVSVKDFGAVGDGVADDTAALNSGGATGQLVILPGGTYKATGSVALAAGTVFRAQDGASVIISFSGSPTFLNDALYLNGVGAGIEGIGINITAGDYRRTVDMRASYTSVRRCRINVTSAGIDSIANGYVIFAATGVDQTNLVIEQNDIRASGANLFDAMQVSNAPGIQIVRNRVHDYTTTQTAQDNKLVWGIYVSSASPGTLIQGNIVQNTNTSGIHKNSSTQDAGLRVVDNYVDTVEDVGIAIQKADGATVDHNWVSNCDLPFSLDAAQAQVTANHFESVVTRGAGAINVNKPLAEMSANASGSMWIGNTFGAAGGAALGVDNTSAATDVGFVGNNWLGTSPKQPLNSTGARTLVSSNTMAWTATGALYPLLAGVDSTFENNIVSIPAGGAGVKTTANNCMVQGNRFLAGAFAVWVSAGTATTVRNNNATAQTSTVYVDAGTNTTRRGNKISTGPSQGTAVLVGGTVTVSTAEILTGDAVVLTHTLTGGTVGTLTLGTIVNATSFVINSSSGTDTSTVAWEIVH